MTRRFLKLTYAIALICIITSLPITILDRVQFDKITTTLYKAKCFSNNQYVVLEGSAPNDAFVFSETSLSDISKTLNFYCQYHNEIQPYIEAYTEAKISTEIIKINQEFFNFQQSVLSNVNDHPVQYRLEVVKKQRDCEELYTAVIDWIVVATTVFLLLQIIKICYTYVAFGELVWHPFKQTRK